MLAFRCDIDDVVRESIAQVPGARIHQMQGAECVIAPANCAGIVKTALESLGVRFRIESRPGPDMPVPMLPEEALRGIPGLLPWVPAFLAPYQREALRFAIPRAGSACWHPAGAGKSLVAIAWALAKPPCRCIVLTKAAVRGSFASEIRRFTDRRADVFDDTTPRDVRPDASFAIAAWESSVPHVPALLRWKPTCLVLDEVHTVKSPKRFEAIPQEDGSVVFRRKDNRAVAAMTLSRAAPRRLSTTATPIRDRLRDLWAQLDLVEPGQWGGYYQFARRYCAAHENPWGGLDTGGRSNIEELKARLVYSTHVVDSATTHGQLPPKRRIATYVSAAEQVASKGFARELEEASARGGGSYLEARLAEAASRKRKAVVDFASEALDGGAKVVVFTGRRRDAEELEKFVRKSCPGVPVWMGHGGTPPGARDAMRESYMASPGPCVLVGTGEAWGTGIGLQDTDLLILAMLPYTPGQVIQWEGRVSRHGQKRPVLVRYLVAEGTVDEHVASILVSKLPAVAQVAGDAQADVLADDIAGLGDEEAIVDSILAKLRASPG